MTREELKRHCLKLIESCEKWARYSEQEPYGKVYEENKLILELLEQEPTEFEEVDFVQEHKKIPVTLDLTPCDNAISREDALMCLTGEIKETDTIETIIARSGRRIRKLPSVKPQEPCEDAISRQTVVEHYSTGELAHCNHISRNNLLDFIEQLPPVTPQPKMGHWIDDKCSVCGKGIEDLIDSREWYRNEQPNFCPFCGVKLADSQERKYVEPQEIESEEDG